VLDPDSHVVAQRDATVDRILSRAGGVHAQSRHKWINLTTGPVGGDNGYRHTGTGRWAKSRSDLPRHHSTYRFECRIGEAPCCISGDVDVKRKLTDVDDIVVSRRFEEDPLAEPRSVKRPQTPPAGSVIVNVFQSAPHVASTRDGFIDARDRRIELRVLAKGGHRSRTPRHVAHRDDEERGVSLSQVDLHLIIPDPVMFRFDRSQPLA
jgi:hypothetical protein